MSIPLIGFAAYSGTGKTTVLERLIRCLTGRGLRVGVIKHDAHGFKIDQPGKDSWRHTRAGSRATLITSPDQTALILREGLSLEESAAMMRDIDLILVEGFKSAQIPRIGLSRKATGLGLPEPPDTYIAVVSDEEISTARPCFSLEDTEGLADFIMEEIKRMPQQDFTHFDEAGRARMVDVGEKPVSRRTAVAAARVLVSRETFDLIRSGGMKKGDVLTVAQVAGIMGAKRTPDLIPMCHPIPLSGINLALTLDEERLSVEITATVSCDGRTGVEMEALTAASTAALTVYDMCKAVQKDMVITDLRLIEKHGGVHGDYHREDD
ncbi:MAG: cyclic pyranopterin monophosphate synthase MoaC [Clostridia bacterium]|nr:cyclic pyranopterin monophosphate synthase MoaC [Clostridia bacterium]